MRSAVTALSTAQYSNHPACVTPSVRLPHGVVSPNLWTNQPSYTVANGYAPQAHQSITSQYSPFSDTRYYNDPSSNSIPQVSFLRPSNPMYPQNSQEGDLCDSAARNSSRTAYLPGPVDPKNPYAAPLVSSASSFDETVAHPLPVPSSSILAFESSMLTPPLITPRGCQSEQVASLPHPACGHSYDSATYQNPGNPNNPPTTPLKNKDDPPFSDVPLSREGSPRGTVSDASFCQPRRPESCMDRLATVDSSAGRTSWPKEHRTKQRIACQGCRGKSWRSE